MRRVVLPLVVLALLAGVGLFLRSGHRAVSEPVPADFEYAVLEPGAVRLFHPDHEQVRRTHRGWTACGGHYATDPRRDGDSVVLGLTFVPDAALLRCDEDRGGFPVYSGSFSGDVQADEGMAVPLDDLQPTTVRSSSGADPVPLLDPTRGPRLTGADWTRSVNFMSFQGSGVPTALLTSWDSSSTGVHMTSPLLTATDQPEEWLRTGDLGPESDYWREAPRVGQDAFSIDGIEVRVVFRRWDTETHVSVWTEDGRHVLDLDVGDAPIPEVRRLVRSLRVG